MDIFDWSPGTSDNNMIDDYCWTADTLFSTINTPFPFPDPREIGKCAINCFGYESVFLIDLSAPSFS